VEGLDAVYVGPSDLSMSLGCKPTFDDVEPKVQQAIEHIAERAKAHGLKAGIHNGRTDVAQARIELGYRFVTLASDVNLLVEGSRRVLGAMRGSLGGDLGARAKP
jgi:4-hydroxy-2-oxoheptanedioate aldolase